MSRRDPWLDMIRGLSLVVMTLDHLPVPIIHHLSYQPFGFFTAAHVFFFLSGWITGKQFGRMQVERGAEVMTETALKRAGKIFTYHVGTVVFTALCMAVHRDAAWRAAFPLYVERPFFGPLATILLIHLPGLFIVLPCYFWFFLAAPFVLRQLAAGKTKSVVALSAALFALAQWSLFTPPEEPTQLYSGYFNMAGWQAVFFGGLILGNARKYAAAPIALPRIALPISVLVLASLACVRHLRALVGSLQYFRTSPAVDARIPGWITLANFAIFVLACGFLSDGFRVRATSTRIGRGLTVLGRNSLQVFVWHVALYMCLMPFDRSLSATGPITQLLIGAIGVASLFIPAVVRSEYLKNRRHGLRAVPA